MSENTKYVFVKDYWSLEGDVSNGFNRLKAKIYNLIEATIIEKKQQEAIIGLIKGFANDEYRNCIENMRYSAKCANLIPENEGQSIIPLSAEPLESREV